VEFIKAVGKSEIQDENIATSTIILGEPKVGKTTLATSASEDGLAILFNFENRVRHIKESDTLKILPAKNKICQLENIKNVTKFVRENPDHGIKYVIFDTVDSWFFNLQREVFNVKSRTSITFDERTNINLTINDCIDCFKNEFNINVIMNLHTKKDNETGKIGIGLDNDLKKIINKYADNVFYLEIGMNKKRVLYTGNHYLYQCGNSSELGKPMPEQIEEPTWKKILELLKG